MNSNDVLVPIRKDLADFRFAVFGWTELVDSVDRGRVSVTQRAVLARAVQPILRPVKPPGRPRRPHIRYDRIASMWLPGSTWVISVIQMQLIPIDPDALFLDVYEHPPRSFNFDQGGIQRLVCLEQDLVELPFKRERSRAIQLDYIFTSRFRNH